MSLKYYNKAQVEEKETYYRALDIRLCLEKICTDLLIQFIPETKKEKWLKLSLHNNLINAKSFMDNNIIIICKDYFIKRGNVFYEKK